MKIEVYEPLQIYMSRKQLNYFNLKYIYSSYSMMSLVAKKKNKPWNLLYKYTIELGSNFLELWAHIYLF
jgi:hypothetical protein